MAVKADYDNTDCWQVEGEPFLDWAKGEVLGVTLGPRAASADPDHGHDHDSIYHNPFEGYLNCKYDEKKAIRQSWLDIVTILKRMPPFDSDGLLETRNFGADMPERKADEAFIRSTDQPSISHPILTWIMQMFSRISKDCICILRKGIRERFASPARRIFHVTMGT